MLIEFDDDFKLKCKNDEFLVIPNRPIGNITEEEFNESFNASHELILFDLQKIPALKERLAGINKMLKALDHHIESECQKELVLIRKKYEEENANMLISFRKQQGELIIQLREAESQADASTS